MHPELFTIPGVNITIPTFGAVVMLGFLIATWSAARRAARVKVDPEMALNIGLVAIFSSLIGARAFYVIHYWQEQFAGHPELIFNLRGGGMELYGGIIGGFTCSVLYLAIKKAPLRLWADIVTPGLLFAMGLGRIGCFGLGCCWGGLCSPQLPWAVEFPYGSPPHQRQWENRQISVPAEFVFVQPAGSSGLLPRQLLDLSSPDLDAAQARLAKALEEADKQEDAGKRQQSLAKLAEAQRGFMPMVQHLHAFHSSPEQLRAAAANDPGLRSLPVHPSQLYGAIGPVLLSWLTAAYFYRRRRHGTVFVLGFMLYAVQRFIEEAVRTDNPHDSFGLTISQAISVAIFVALFLWYLYIRRLPLGSPNAVPWIHPSKRPVVATADPVPA